ncbi:uncharacterized protein LOC9308350 isoform X2 [Arabidopsis lyrata subsp. lyrata]|uniref:uncharacterized protein LOC9308350 isoform X2 n=1 Tax=Arabidopsis lyrata subsp. lyrata TaxID=81972 RepID=UPI000A29B54B|nr:uncharacterized protein LOC9308350 isoform X2 [Arabidopsis lyrata subsp. lyrata]|eukprot:XP_020876881.1 uncharacterized protein LOC9308350 isoform X2 [Arabidopsis lyrata subsp. lyrata]
MFGTPSSSPSFGTPSSTPAFGTSSPAFGTSSATPAFGTPSVPSFSSGGFGSSLFSTPFSSQQPQQQQQQQQPSSLFQQQPSSSFGFQSPFNNTAQQQTPFPNAQLTTQMAPVAPIPYSLADRDVQAIIEAYKEDPTNPKYAFQLQDEVLASDRDRIKTTQSNVKMLQRHLQASTFPSIERLRQKEQSLQRRMLRGLGFRFSTMAILGRITGVTRISRNNSRVRVCPVRYFQSKDLSNTNSFNGEDAAKLPVLIVGAGPVGLVLSILLTKLGVKCAVVDKATSFSKHPQAHFINNRSMEIFRALDGLAEEIERSQPPVDLWRKFIYCTSLSGSTLGTVDHMQPQDFEKVVSPASVAHFSQYKLTNLLLKRLGDLGFHVRGSKESDGLEVDAVVARQILMGHECVAIDANKDSITATVSYLKGGKHMKRNIQCSILVGADGAGSAVRKLTAIEMRGERDLQKLVSVHFMSRELGEYLISRRPGMLFFIFNTDGIGVLVAHDLLQGEFVLQIPYYPPQQSLSDFSPEMCRMLIYNLVGHELSDLDVADIKPWVMHAEVAEKFMCCENRVILAGDAAHRFPPAGGFGMNTGIQDAHNLTWKIAALVQGSAKSSILKTYETERRPIALSNTSLSVQNFRAAMSVPSALGLDPTVANSVHRFINKTVGSILPTGLQKAILDNVFALGRAQLSESLLNESNPLGNQRLRRVKSIFERGKSLQLQFPAEDLGFRYLEGAIVPDNESEAGDPELPSGRRRDYVPCAEPGSRLPHMYVKILSDSTREVIVSTLDLVSTEKVEFLLIISPLQESYELARATFKVAKEFMANVKVCVVWPSSDEGLERESNSALAPWENYVDVMEVIRQNGEGTCWWSICKMSERGSILVRPDQHIAWRAKSGITLDPTLHMREAFSIILGKQ